MPTRREPAVSRADRAARLARLVPWLSVLAGAVLSGRTLLAPFYADDLLQRAMVIGGFPARRSPFDLYDFVRAGERTRFVELGALPWWTDESYHLRFLRPLVSVELYVEHRLLGSALAMHALSLAWWAGAVLAAAWLYRRVLEPRPAALATLIFALAPCHVPALALVAQRDVVVASLFAALALGVLGSSGRSPSARAARARLGAGTLFAAALAAGEYGLCFVGYGVLLAAARPPGSERRRVGAVVVVPAIAYVALRSALGYGAAGTGFYRDPFVAPWRFLAHAPRALAALATDAWSTFDADGASAAWLVAGVLGAALATWAARECPGWLRWGALFALVPVVGSAPGQRLVGPALLGVAPAVAVLVERGLASPRRFAAAGVAAALFGLHVGHASVATWTHARAALGDARARAAREAFLTSRSTRAGATGVVVLSSWDTAFFPGVAPGAEPRTTWRVLVNARHALLLRGDARTFDVVVPAGQGFFPAGTDDIFRPEDHPLHAGDVDHLPGVRVAILRAGASPPRIRFTFARAPDEAPFVWLTQKRSGYEPIVPPAVGYGLQLTP